MTILLINAGCISDIFDISALVHINFDFAGTFRAHRTTVKTLAHTASIYRKHSPYCKTLYKKKEKKRKKNTIQNFVNLVSGFICQLWWHCRFFTICCPTESCIPLSALFQLSVNLLFYSCPSHQHYIFFFPLSADLIVECESYISLIM